MNVREKPGTRAKAGELDREMMGVINDNWSGWNVGLQYRQRSNRYHNTFDWRNERSSGKSPFM